MRLIKTIIFFALLGYAVLFCVSNFQNVDINFPFITEFASIPLFLIMIFCVIVGMLLSWLIGTYKEIKGFAKINKVKKENKNLKDKLDIYQTEEKINENI